MSEPSSDSPEFDKELDDMVSRGKNEELDEMVTLGERELTEERQQARNKAKREERQRQRATMMGNIEIIISNVAYINPSVYEYCAPRLEHVLNINERVNSVAIMRSAVWALIEILKNYPFYAERIFRGYKGVFNLTPNQSTIFSSELFDRGLNNYIRDFAKRYEKVILALPKIKESLNPEEMPLIYSELEAAAIAVGGADIPQNFDDL